MRRLLPALLVTVFLAAAGSADAAPRWLDAELPFGDAPALTGDASAAMAPDGTAVYARFAPDGALEVRERPPGGPVGPTISLQKVTVAPPPQSQLEVLTGADGSAALTFNVGGIRFASVRAAGGRWTDPSEAAPAGGQAALAPDGVLWIVARSPALDDTLSVYRFGPDGRTETTPLPATNARQLVGALTVPTAGEAHVAFLEQAAAPGEGDRCVLRSKVRAVDVFANGTTGIAHTLDQVDADGTGTAENCAADSGSGILGSLLLSTDAVGADTVVYTRLALEDFTVTPFARHRDPGGAWPAIIAPPELVSDADVLAETLIGGAGDPVVVVRQGAGKAIATRRADGTWTPVKPFGFEGATSLAAARTGAGTVAFAWVAGAVPQHVVGRVLEATGTLGAPTPLAPATAVRVALLTGIPMFLLSAVAGPLMLIVPVAGGFFAVYLYRQRTGQQMTVLAGARLGWISGIIVFTILTVLLTVVVLMLSQPDFLQSMRDQMAKMSSISQEELTKRIELLRTPSALAQGQGHQQPGCDRLRRVYARTGGHSLLQGRAHPRRPR